MDGLLADLHAIILDHLSRLETYTIRKGRAKDEIIAEFQKDPLYSIFGLDSPEYVAAILGGGTITSIHRKIGDLYEQCVHTIIVHQLGLPAAPRFTAAIVSGDVEQKRTIDVYIPFDALGAKIRVRLEEIATREVLSITATPKVQLIGMGFEVRHCYQSADSKRVQADEAMARYLMFSGVLPVMLVFCNQSNRQVMTRYRGTWMLKEGMASYHFLEEITAFSFYEFLLAHKDQYRDIVRRALRRVSE